MSEVPEPTSSGVDGSQAQGNSLIPVSVAPPMQAATIPDAIDGLIATHSRNLGGDIAARLLAASMRETSNQLAAAHQKISNSDAEVRFANEMISNLKIDVATLKEKLHSARGIARAKSFSTFVGTALLGIAIELYKNQFVSISIVTGFLGIALLIFVLIPMSGGSEE